MAPKSSARKAQTAASRKFEVVGRKRGLRVRADGKKLAVPLASYDRPSATTTIRERRERLTRSIGVGVVEKLADEKKKQTNEDLSVGRRSTQVLLLGRRASRSAED